MTWSDYVRSIVGADRQSETIRKTGIDQATISRWLVADGLIQPSARNARAFADGYQRDVVEAFVAAGFLAADEAEDRAVKIPMMLDDDAMTLEDLTAELRRVGGQLEVLGERLARRAETG